MVGWCQHRIVAEDHFHRDLDLSMFRGKLLHHSRNLPTDSILAFFRNEAAVDENLESVRNNIPLLPTLRSINVESRFHFLNTVSRLRVDPRSSLADLFT